MSYDFSLLMKSLPLLFQGACSTLELATYSILIGLVGGILVGILNCQKFRVPAAAFVLSSFVWIVRGTPLFVQVLMIYYALPELLGFSLSPFMAGVIALGLNSTAYISEIVRGGIDSIPKGQWESAYVIGLSAHQTLKKVILPQMFRTTLPSLINELTALIKETSILMVIGVAELTKVSKDIVARQLDPATIYLTTAILYLCMTSFLTWLTKSKQKSSCYD